MSQAIVEKANLESVTFTEPPGRNPPHHLRGPRLDHFTERALPRLFEDQVALGPRKIAVTCENESLTFGELNARANQLAHHLRRLGLGRESLIGICVDRSLEMAVGMLGILKSGAAYLPLDPEYPQERLAFMLSDARPPLIVTKSSLAGQLPPGQSRILRLDGDWPTIAGHSEANVAETPRPSDLAYVIYTSGSTGQPKGVMIEHGNLANYLLALDHKLHITSEDVYLHTASIAFSSSRRQLMLPLSQGATVVIATSDQRRDPLALFQMIKHRNVTVMDAVPSFWRSCTAMLEDLDDRARRELLDNRLRLMLSASEPMLSDIPRTWMTRFAHPARHVHMFGQTETAGIVALNRVPAVLDNELSVLPIGHPIANSEIYILDADQRPCELGVAGEIYIGGAGVGRGYLNRPELTAEKFIPHPFDQRDGARLYRTGDWARHRSDGQIEFAGRRDQQVKLRGFRIELGEVETALSSHPLIRECVVIAHADERASNRLIAYLVAEGSLHTADLRSFLSARLPEYAVPSAFVQMDALPLSANGKVDRLGLTEPESAGLKLSSDYVAPRTPAEERLAGIWRQVLRLERVGTDDNFFELGGHSLLAAQIVARVRSEFRMEVSLRALFESPTIALMAHRLERIGVSEEASFAWAIEAIGPMARQSEMPLSFTQQQFWLLDQAEPESCYNVCTAIRIEGRLDIQRLQQALAAVEERHEILRTNIVTSESGPIQIIAPAIALPFDVLDLRRLTVSQRENEIHNLAATEAQTRFNLSSGPLLRAKVLQISLDENVLLITAHHLVCDGWSVGVLLREVASLYQDASDGRPGSLPRLRIQYADFALWQRSRFSGNWLEQQLEYWKEQLGGATPILDLPTDYPRPERNLFEGAQESIVLPPELSAAISKLGQQEGATLFMVLLAAFQTLLFRYSGQEDVLVGSPVAGRAMLETENLIGAFVNTLVLRADFAGRPSFRDFLGRVRETTLGAFSNQEVPFEKLVEELNPERKVNRTPLFQAMFALQNSPKPELAIAGLRLAPMKLPAVKAKFDLTLEAEQEPGGLRLSFEYNSALFRSSTISRMLGHFRNLLNAIALDPSQSVTELPLLTDSERHELLRQGHGVRLPFDEGACIHTLFEAQVARTPDAIAAEHEGRQLTYRELNLRANRLAHFLRTRAVGPDTLVGICVERSLDMLVGMLGVLKAGGAYVPLDPAYPADRLSFMIADARLSLVLTQEHLTGDLPGEHAALFCLDQDWESIVEQSDENPALNVGSANLAYVIYTSGSTGNPKGVMIEHRALFNFSQTAAAAYEISPADRVLQFASLCFDLSVEEIYPALMRGATVVLRADEMISSARDFLDACERWQTTMLDLPTAYWHELTDALSASDLKLPAAVRLVIIGGEKASADRVAAWHRLVSEDVRLVNTYGPTETTVAATMCELLPQDEIQRRGIVPIGRPFANVNVCLLDESLKPVPLGAPGELHIGGPGLARGYVNRPELTAEKFIQDPFAAEQSARLYKTGDLVRYRSDGNIEFLGRIDNQIKIRGFRVELGEIEQALRTQAGVKDCVVLLREAVDGDKRLIAYVVGDSPLSVSELRTYLKTKLPSYMVPASFDMIGTLPLLPNGKINRRALPEPQAARLEVDENFVAPRTPFERLLALEWSEVLKIERIGVHDNFFELGGHSLLAAKVVSRVRSSLEVELGMVDLFQAPTIASLAALLFPRGMQSGSQGELAELLREIAALTDEEAQHQFDREMATGEVAAA